MGSKMGKPGKPTKPCTILKRGQFNLDDDKFDDGDEALDELTYDPVREMRNKASLRDKLGNWLKGE